MLSVPCSASISRSAASSTGSAVSSAITRLSVGPSSIIVATPWRCISTWARVTAGDPGPTILRTCGIVSVPKPSAAMPAGPFTRNTSAMPSLRHTTSTAGSTSPALPGIGGTTSDDRRHAGDDGRHGELVGDARVAGLARRCEQPGGGDRRDLLADRQTGLALDRPVVRLLHLGLVERPQVGDRVVERRVDLGVTPTPFELVGAHPQLVGRRRRSRRTGASASQTAASPRSRTSSISSPIERRSAGSKMSSRPRRISASRAATSMSFQTCRRITVTARRYGVHDRRTAFGDRADASRGGRSGRR